MEMVAGAGNADTGEHSRPNSEPLAASQGVEFAHRPKSRREGKIYETRPTRRKQAENKSDCGVDAGLGIVSGSEHDLPTPIE